MERNPIDFTNEQSQFTYNTISMVRVDRKGNTIQANLPIDGFFNDGSGVDAWRKLGWMLPSELEAKKAKEAKKKGE